MTKFPLNHTSNEFKAISLGKGYIIKQNTGMQPRSLQQCLNTCDVVNLRKTNSKLILW